MRVKNWVRAKLADSRTTYQCYCDICRYGWTVWSGKPSASVDSMCRHLADYHGGVDLSD